MREQHQTVPTTTNHPTESPVGWGRSLLLFGVPGVVLVVTVHLVNPVLVEAGVPLVVSFTLSLYGVLFGLLVATFVALRRSGHPMHRAALVERLRLRPLRGREWWWVVGAVAVAFAADAALEPAMSWMADTVPLPIPDHLPNLFDPREELSLPPTEYLGVTLEGSWWILVVYAFGLVGNIIGEELWWRGYVLPRQELAFGARAWIVNGVLWVVVFHAFMWWAFPTLLATGLLTPLVAQRLRSTWAAIVVHGTGNALFLLLLLAGVLGAG
ncbi:MAG TPA: CPBP family intramembrane glutamic endopeptidase [Ilumatobacteraceae bacterium]|nr:CPBP family intramembrane glutamic endopeptidase [Ilumatobacteraceae bacterium]